jgi:hypothetical protein
MRRPHHEVAFFCCKIRFVHIYFQTITCTRKPLFYESSASAFD